MKETNKGRNQPKIWSEVGNSIREEEVELELEGTMTKGPQAYGEASYWDERYKQDSGSFDWYQQYSGLSPLLDKYAPKTSRILMVGCGNAGQYCFLSSNILFV